MKRTFLLITILLLLLCGCRQNEHTAIFQGNELLNNPLAIRNDGVCFEASDDLCSMLQSLQGKKSNGQLRDACAHFRFVISRTTQIGETAYTKTVTDDHWTDIYLSRDGHLQLEEDVYEIADDACKQLLQLFERVLGEEREPSFSGTVDFLVVNPFLSSMFSVREYRSIFQQIVNGMEFSDYDTVRPYRQVNEYGLYCGGFISLDEDVVFFNGKPYQTDEKKVEQLRDFYTRINDLVVNAEKPFEGVAIQSVTTSDKDGNTMTMDQEQCSVLSLLIQDIAVYEPITEPSIWEWSTIYIGDLLLGDGSHIELYAGQEVVVVNGVMLHVSIDSSNNLIHFIKAIRSK